MKKCLCCLIYMYVEQVRTAHAAFPHLFMRLFRCSQSTIALSSSYLTQMHSPLLRGVWASTASRSRPPVLRVNLHQTHINLVHVENSLASASADYGPPIGVELSRPLPFYGTELPGSTVDSAITIDAGKSLYIFPRVGVDGQHPVILSSEATLGLKSGELLVLFLWVADHFDDVGVARDVEVVGHMFDGAIDAFVFLEREVCSEGFGQWCVVFLMIWDLSREVRFLGD